MNVLCNNNLTNQSDLISQVRSTFDSKLTSTSCASCSSLKLGISIFPFHTWSLSFFVPVSNKKKEERNNLVIVDSKIQKNDDDDQ